jgi:hypothetical protein
MISKELYEGIKRRRDGLRPQVVGELVEVEGAIRAVLGPFGHVGVWIVIEHELVANISKGDNFVGRAAAREIGKDRYRLEEIQIFSREDIRSFKEIYNGYKV